MMTHDLKYRDEIDDIETPEFGPCTGPESAFRDGVNKAVDIAWRADDEIALLRAELTTVYKMVMGTKIKTYLQDMPKEWLKNHPNQKWRCDIYPSGNSDHHGVSNTEAGSIHEASLAYLGWIAALRSSKQRGE
jgi:hypothetical protein